MMFYSVCVCMCVGSEREIAPDFCKDVGESGVLETFRFWGKKKKTM